MNFDQCPTRRQIESLAQAEGIQPSQLWTDKRLVCSYLISLSMEDIGKNLKNGEKALIKFTNNLEFMVIKKNGKITVNLTHLAWMLGHDLSEIPFSKILRP